MPPLSVSIIPADSAVGMSSDITSLYKDVFASPPWNEAYQCVTCMKSFPKGFQNAVCCDTVVCEYYPQSETRVEIESCFNKTRARVATILESAEQDPRIVGFAWGWEETFSSLNKSKLHLPDETFEELRQRCGIRCDDPLFYFSEFGVREEMRGMGLGKRMYRELFSSIDRTDAKGIFMRTSKQSPAFHVASTCPDFPLKLVYEYRDDLERVILSSLPVKQS